MKLEILGHRNFLVLELESHGFGTVFKVDVVDCVATPVTPVGDDDLSIVLRPDGSLKRLRVFGALFHVVNCVKARSRAHEFEDTVHAEHST